MLFYYVFNYYLCFFMFFPQGRVVLYIVFMVLALPKTLVKTLAKDLIKNLAKNLVKNHRTCVRKIDRRLTGTLIKTFKTPPLSSSPQNRK